MANELTIDINAQLANGSHEETFQTGQLQFDQAAIGAHAPVVIVGQAAEEDLDVGDISTEGWLFLRNLDSTNYVTYGPKSGGVMVPLGRLEPGEPASFRLEPGVVLRWQADTADVKVKVLLLED